METKNETAKIKDETVDEVTSALVAFFDRKGGHIPVANKIGVNPQQLYYIITGRNAPTLKTVMRILRYYPNEMELRRAISLPATISLPEQNTANYVDMPGAQMLSISEDASYWKARYQEVEGKMLGMESKINALMSQFNQVMETNDLLKKIIKKLDPSFNTADRIFTALAPIDPIGFVLTNVNRAVVRTECKVIQHPNTYNNVRRIGQRSLAVSAQG